MQIIGSDCAVDLEMPAQIDGTVNNTSAVQSSPQVIAYDNGEFAISAQPDSIGNVTNSRDNRSISPPASILKSTDAGFDQQQIQELCRVLWPTPQPLRTTAFMNQRRKIDHLALKMTSLPQEAQRANRFFVKDMKGGGYNRIVGIKPTTPYGETGTS